MKMPPSTTSAPAMLKSYSLEEDKGSGHSTIHSTSSSSSTVATAKTADNKEELHLQQQQLQGSDQWRLWVKRNERQQRYKKIRLKSNLMFDDVDSSVEDFMQTSPK